ncbi:MAG: DUF1049 domain-containing protein [Pseudomonadota bacterium]
MQILRTILLIAVLLGIVAFTFGNFDRATEVRIWPGLVWDTRVPAIVIVSFLLGIVPTWLYHRGVKWSLNRRIRSLENAVKSNALSRRHEPAPGTATPVATETMSAPAASEEPLAPADPVPPAKTDSQ